ncbi:hypothetical protein [Metabacillus arenae]|uniref:Uncharacterized protein n=1 Tax=Metabacillus arenae TaxID=2771434 RepID=A0A926NIF7_9BACI|nr:hypothetical protein [Metabacillus arenae]MBD1381655.1 hypothetical protein [Metabacillus arenae]
MTNRNDNRERKNKYPNNKSFTKNAQDLAKDPTPENNPKYGSHSHKNS